MSMTSMTIATSAGSVTLYKTIPDGVWGSPGETWLGIKGYRHSLNWWRIWFLALYLWPELQAIRHNSSAIRPLPPPPPPSGDISALLVHETLLFFARRIISLCASALSFLPPPPFKNVMFPVKWKICRLLLQIPSLPSLSYFS